MPWFTLMGQFSAVNRDDTFVCLGSNRKSKKLDDLALQKGSWLEVCCCSLLAIGIARSGCRGTVRRLVGGGFSTAWRTGRGDNPTSGQNSRANLVAQKMLIHPFSLSNLHGRNATSPYSKSLSTHKQTHEAAVSTAVE